MTVETTYVEPTYQRTRANHTPIDGVKFFSYTTGIQRYARISEDGQIIVSSHGQHRSTYGASVLGHGALQRAGKSIRFRTQEGAARAAIKVWRKLKAEKK